MLKVPISEVINKIKEETKLSEKEIKEKIKEKISLLEGLVSEEGAAYIIASELGVSLLNSPKVNDIKVENVSEGMNSVDIIGKVMRVFPPKHWEKGRNRGTVASIIIADKTGTMRVVIWDERVKLIDQGTLKEGINIQIKNGNVKLNKRGERELHLNYNSQLIINPEGVEIDEKNLPKIEKKVKEVTISEIEEGDRVQVRGSIVQAFNPYFYTVCSKCGKKVLEDAQCTEHGEINPVTAIVFNFVIDDGTGTLRAVAFKQTAQNILSFEESPEKLSEESPESLREQINNKLLGKSIILEGVIRKNDAFERTELIVNNVETNIDVKKILDSLRG